MRTEYQRKIFKEPSYFVSNSGVPLKGLLLQVDLAYQDHYRVSTVKRPEDKAVVSNRSRSQSIQNIEYIMKMNGESNIKNERIRVKRSRSRSHGNVRTLN